MDSKNQLVNSLREIDKLTCNMPIMDHEVQEGFRIRPSMEAYRVEVNKVILAIRETARQAIERSAS